VGRWQNRSQSKRGARRFGCLYLVLVCLTATLLLVLNGAVVWACVQALASTYPELTHEIKYFQGIMLIAPVIMILIEYRVYDWLVDCLAPIER
jgi:hypothetical protein